METNTLNSLIPTMDMEKIMETLNSEDFKKQFEDMMSCSNQPQQNLKNLERNVDFIKIKVENILKILKKHFGEDDIIISESEDEDKTK